MSVSDNRLAALIDYNETMADRYGLRKLWHDEVEHIPWDDWEGMAQPFPDGIASCAARYARETTSAQTVAWVMPDGKLSPAEGRNEPPITQAFAVVFSGLSPTRTVDSEAEAVRYAKESAQKAREQRIVGLCLKSQGNRKVLSTRHLEQIAWVFGYGPQTIKGWRVLHFGRGTPGRPRNSRFRAP